MLQLLRVKVKAVLHMAHGKPHERGHAELDRGLLPDSLDKELQRSDAPVVIYMKWKSFTGESKFISVQVLVLVLI